MQRNPRLALPPQRLIYTASGAGFRAGLLVRDGAWRSYLLTCGHPFHRDEPFVRTPLGSATDGAGRAVTYARLGTENSIDAALIACSDEVGVRSNLTVGPVQRTLLLGERVLLVQAVDVRIRLENIWFTGMAMAEGPLCHRGESGSVVLTEQGQPAAIVIGVADRRVVLCPLDRILNWFEQQSFPGLHPVAFAIQGK